MMMERTNLNKRAYRLSREPFFFPFIILGALFNLNVAMQCKLYCNFNTHQDNEPDQVPSESTLKNFGVAF